MNDGTAAEATASDVGHKKAWEETSAAVATPYQELEDALRGQPVLNCDETGHRTNGEKRWLWTLVAPAYVFYTITTSRGADVLIRLLGPVYAGILGSDPIADLHHLSSRATAILLGPFHTESPPSDGRFIAAFVHHQHFFTFVEYEGVEPTNNAAERALRTAVQWRKIMLGTRSAEGDRGRTLAHHHAHLSNATAQCARVSRGRRSMPPPPSDGRFIAAEEAVTP